MVKDSRIGDYFRLKKELEEKKSELSRLEYEYNSIINQEPYMQGRLKSRQHTLHKLRGEIKSLEKEINNMVKIKDCMDILKLSGFTYDSLGGKGYTILKMGKDPQGNEEVTVRIDSTGQTKSFRGLEAINEAYKWIRSNVKDSCNKVFTKGSKDDDATENGSIKEYGKNKEIEKMNLENDPVLAQDDLSSLSKNWTSENIKHILANPQLYRPEVVEEAKRINEGYSKDAYNRSDWENNPRHYFTISSIKSEIDKVKRRLENNRQRIPQLRSMVNSGKYGPSTLKELKEEEADYQANQMRIQQLISMMQRAQGQKDADPRVAEANAIINLCGGVM